MTAAANRLIATLKAELAAQTTLAREGQRLKQELQTSEGRIETLQTTIADMTNSLSDAKTEIKTLSTKLAASRCDAPGSAINGTSARPLAHHEILQSMQMKEDLYGDLTGLIVRNIKHDAGEDVYDCIQTGRNGSKCTQTHPHT
jgi:predicted  nucleic acid-binding Zn-ribbon protein